jgi:CTP synthase (UTP-ammonia lyase)
VLRVPDADTAENDSGSAHIVIWPVSCEVPNRAPGAPKLSGGGHKIQIERSSLLHAIYGAGESEEGYFCNYEVNPEYEAKLTAAGLVVTARGPAGEIRAVELHAHPFFLATLYQPQLSSTLERPHPILLAFARHLASS